MTTTIPAITRGPDEPVEYGIGHALQVLAAAIIDVGTTPTMVDIVVQYPVGDLARVDDLAKAIVAPPPQLEQMHGDSWHHSTRLRCDALHVSVFCGADEPAEHKRDRLRRELADLDAQIGDGT